MGSSAFQTMYRDEYIAGFEKEQSLARRSVITETEINGNEATFLVADSGGAEAVTRGLNGDIPSRPDNLNQYVATLQEWHDKPVRTRFNIYASQGNGRAIMQRTSRGVINRKIDKDIHSALDNGTQTQTMTQTGKSAFLASLLQLKVTLGNNDALGENPYALITDAFHANMMTLEQYTSVDFVSAKPFDGISTDRAFSWLGVNWILDTGLTGKGTATSTCYMYNRNAIGHACDMERLTTAAGYDEENDKSWARATAFMGSKLLQNSGVIKITHDDTTIITAA